jgi:hypothetical protein
MIRLRRRLRAALLVAALLPACAWETEAGGARSGANATPSAFTSVPAPPQATVALPRCRFPKEVPYPGWVPDDLPLPDGVYAYENLKPAAGYQRAFFVLRNTTTAELTKLVLREWPKAGYTLGRGDAEPGEVEDDFHKPPGVGAFKANDVYCRPGYSVMYLIWAPDGPKGDFILPSPTSRGTPLT